MNEFAPTPTPPHPAEQRVSALVGDRLCTKCGYNLTGQPVLREPHYNMLIVRCPECGTAASMQEYPLLGRWAGRWAAVLAGLWFLVLAVLWIATAAAMFGFCMAAATNGIGKYSDFLGDQFSAFEAAHQPAGSTGTPSGFVGFRGAGPGFHAWWQAADKSALLRQAGGWRGALDWETLYWWIPLGLCAFIFGCFWAAALLGRTRGSLLVWALVEMVAVGGFASIGYIIWLTDEPSWSYDAAMRQLCPTLMTASLVLTAIVLVIGLMVGRPVVRAMICLLLPPRLRGSLALFWIADGLTPPVPSNLRG